MFRFLIFPLITLLNGFLNSRFHHVNIVASVKFDFKLLANKGRSVQLFSYVQKNDLILNRKAFIFGLGYTGMEVANSLSDDGWTVCGTSTSIEKVEYFQKKGMKTYLFKDGIFAPHTKKDAYSDLLTCTHLVSTIPPLLNSNNSNNNETSNDIVYDTITSAELNLFHNNQSCLRWIGYLSSTSVYGNCNGTWVNEEFDVSNYKVDSSIMHPNELKMKARILAENIWLNKLPIIANKTLPIHIFRLGGIYGKKRNIFETILKTNQNNNMTGIGCDNSIYISRINVKDIVHIIKCSIYHPTPNEIYNVVDNIPSTRYEVLQYAFKLLNYPPINDSNIHSK
eukprot:gene6638-9112_t